MRLDLSKRSLLAFTLLAVASASLFYLLLSANGNTDRSAKTDPAVAGDDRSQQASEEGVVEIQFAASDEAALRGQVTVETGRVINPDIIGFGMNIAFSDHTYVVYPGHSEWESRSQHLPKPDDEVGWTHFKELMDFMGFEYVRLGVGLTQWEPVNDNDDPWDMNLEDGYVFSPGFHEKNPRGFNNHKIHMEQMYRLLDHFEEKERYVILGNWFAGPDTFCFRQRCNWLVESNDNGTRKYDLYDRANPGVKDWDELTESLAAIMHHLIRDKGYASVKGISFWNEPEHFTNHNETLEQVYTSLGKQLEKYNLRDQVAVQAFDSSMFWTRENGWDDQAVSKLIAAVGEHVDLLAFHDYFSGLEYMKDSGAPNMHGTLKEFMVDRILAPAVEQSAADGKERPVIAGEFGGFSMLKQGEDIHFTKPDFAQRLHSAEGAIQLFNHGGKAIAYWIFNSPFHNYWSALDYSAENPYHFVPSSENYYPLALMMRHFQQGTDIVASQVQGFTDEEERQRLFVTAGVNEGQTTVLIVNDSDKPAHLDLQGLDVGQDLHYWWVNEQNYDGIQYEGRLASAHNQEVSVHPRSITVLTTQETGGSKPSFLQ